MRRRQITTEKAKMKIEHGDDGSVTYTYYPVIDDAKPKEEQPTIEGKYLLLPKRKRGRPRKSS